MYKPVFFFFCIILVQNVSNSQDIVQVEESVPENIFNERIKKNKQHDVLVLVVLCIHNKELASL